MIYDFFLSESYEYNMGEKVSFVINRLGNAESAVAPLKLNYF